MILDEGLEELANQFQSLITKGQWGTGTTTPDSSDTGLESPISATLLSVDTGNSGSSTQITHTTPSTVGNGNTFTEFELQFANGDSFNRSLGGGFSKTSSFEVVALVTVNFLRG